MSALAPKAEQMITIGPSRSIEDLVAVVALRLSPPLDHPHPFRLHLLLPLLRPAPHSVL